MTSTSPLRNMAYAQIGASIPSEVVEGAALIRSVLGLKLADFVESAIRNEIKRRYAEASWVKRQAIKAVADSRGIQARPWR